MTALSAITAIPSLEAVSRILRHPDHGPSIFVSEPVAPENNMMTVTGQEQNGGSGTPVKPGLVTER
jgi:hypothetical protein